MSYFYLVNTTALKNVIRNTFSNVVWYTTSFQKHQVNILSKHQKQNNHGITNLSAALHQK